MSQRQTKRTIQKEEPGEQVEGGWAGVNGAGARTVVGLGGLESHQSDSRVGFSKLEAFY